jgi:hypothetical protein
MLPNDARAQLARDWFDRAVSDLRLARLAVSDASLAGLAAFPC